MNFKLILFKFVPLIALMIGLLPSTNNVAKAAGSSPSKKDPSGKESAAADKHSGSSYYNQVVISDRAHRIEFFIGLGLIGICLVTPELLYKPNSNIKSQVKSSSDSNTNKQTIELAKKPNNHKKQKVGTELDIPSLNVIAKNTNGSHGLDVFLDSLEKPSKNGKPDKEQKIINN